MGESQKDLEQQESSSLRSAVLRALCQHQNPLLECLKTFINVIKETKRPSQLWPFLLFCFTSTVFLGASFKQTNKHIENKAATGTVSAQPEG